MLNFLKKIFGTKHERDIRALKPIVEQINQIYEQLHELTDEQLRQKTEEFRKRIAERTAEVRERIAELRQKLKEDLSHEEREAVSEELKKLEEEEFELEQEVLDEILPEAYAVVKEVCRRLVGTRYTVVGHEVEWDMIPYDVQLMGAIVLHQGKIAEMATGEGKTLVAVMPLYLNALVGKGVHLVTVNDYLARRDSEWMRPVFERLGLTVGCIQSNMKPEERKKAYQADITYGTNNEFGFDYLRDNMVVSLDQMVQRGHYYAIVDEVDSVLIDEARTPLIISGPVEQTDHQFDELNPYVRRLVEAQKKLVAGFVREAEEWLAKQDTDKEALQKAGVALLRAHRGFPKNKRLMKLLQDPANKQLLQDTELEYLRDKGIRMQEIDRELYFAIDEKNHQIDITDKGREFLERLVGEKDMFLLPDLPTEMSRIEGDASLSEEEKQRQKEELLRIYSERSEKIHTVIQLLKAYCLYERDVEYVVQDGKIKIVDEFTGRILEGRRYSEGLHQAIEAKEGVKVQQDTQTLATITIQNYFRLYKKLAGMTGTAETEAAEFYEIYGLDVVVIPTHKPVIREDKDDLIFRTKKEKYQAVIEEIQRLLKQGRAVLVGTTSVEVSELLSKMLRRVGIKHNVLNAKHHQREAEIVAQAGQPGMVTIATNMAGRGTDIKLHPKVREAGGLAIIGTERHESRRIDRQLRGRAGRQGDPGSSQFFISLEDDLMRLFGGERIASIMQRMKVPEGEPIQHKMITKSVERAQKRVEENNFAIRKRLLEYDDVMNQQREVIYRRRRMALEGENLKGEIFEYIAEIAEELYDTYQQDANINAVRQQLRSLILADLEMTAEEFAQMDREEFVHRVLRVAQEAYERKEKLLGSDFMRQLERAAVLITIDEQWREHLRAMDELKEGIHLRAYGQRDPLVEYKTEAYHMFVELIRTINRNIVSFVYRYYPPVIEQEFRTAEADGKRRRLPKVRGMAGQRLRYGKDTSFAQQLQAPVEVPEYETVSAEEGAAVVRKKRQPVRRQQPKIGPNDPCPCGSGRKYKYCHGKRG